jgi:hypothetical protein
MMRVKPLKYGEMAALLNINNEKETTDLLGESSTQF